jgi:hypothetical protein
MGKIKLKMEKNGKYSDPIRIRAHHLLCIQGFQGYGYSPDFAEQMEKIISFLDSNPSYDLQIIVGADEICSHCPHEDNGECERDSDSLNLIGKIDSLVIEKADLEENGIYYTEDALNLVYYNLDSNDIIEICGKCSWNHECLFFIDKTKFK